MHPQQQQNISRKKNKKLKASSTQTTTRAKQQQCKRPRTNTIAERCNGWPGARSMLHVAWDRGMGHGARDTG